MALDVAFLKDGRIALQGQLDELLEGARRVAGPGGVHAATSVGPMGLEELFIEVTR